MFGKNGKGRGGAGRGGGQGGDGPLGRPSEADFDGLVLDESFVKAATVKEETARTRQLREQWKKEPPKAQPWRSWEGEALQHRMSQLSSQADADRARGARNAKAAKKARTWRRIRKSVALVLVVGVIGGGYLFYSHRHIQPLAAVPVVDPSLTAMPAAGAGGAAANVRVSVAPTASCFAGQAGCGLPSRPYDDSPALAWADGADGIVLPAPIATGDFSAAQVSAALDLSKQFVVDQTLVPDVLVGGASPSAMLGLLTPASHYAATLDTWMATPTTANDPSGFFVRFDPKNATLLTTPKVSGTVTYTQLKNGVLQVGLSLKIVYALQKPDKSAWTRTIATVSDELLYYNGKGDYAPTTGTVWPGRLWISDYANSECTPTDGFEEPAYLTDGGAGSGSLADGPAVDPYATTTADPTPAPAASAGEYACGAISRD